MNKPLLVALFFTLILTSYRAQTIVDFDGNIYNTVTIGNQVWMKENLKVTHYNNGNSIPNITSDQLWTTNAIGARCYYNNDSITYSAVYGCLYNFEVAADSNTCPSGWHVASNSDWYKAEKYIDSSVDTSYMYSGWAGTFIGGSLKESGTVNWYSPNTGATNSTGFSALPGSFRQASGPFFLDCNGDPYVGSFGYYWTSTYLSNFQGTDYAAGRYFDYNYSQLHHNSRDVRDGLAIRCVSNSPASLNEPDFAQAITLYPNPAVENITIDIDQMATIEIVNMFGQVVYRSNSQIGKTTIDISFLSQGVYMVQLTGENWVASSKFIKQ
jgi:uncharacterized protein (TIGR02145 family)